MIRLPFIAIGCLAVLGCNQTDHAEPNIAVSEAPMRVSDAKPAPALIDPGMTETICKAAIAKLFGHPIATINAKALGSWIIRTSYRRPSDNTLWKNDCRLEGSRVIWRSVDAFPGSGPGRWRTGEYDGVVTYTITNGEVVVEEKL